MNVLIIDGDQDFCQLLKRSCKLSDAECVLIHSPSGAIVYIKKNRPDVIILDLMMKGGTAFVVTVVKTISLLPEYSPQIILIGTSRLLPWYAKNLHVSVYLQKPFDLKDFKKIILTAKEVYSKTLSDGT